MLIHSRLRLLVMMVIVAGAADSAYSQTSVIPSHRQSYRLDSGAHRCLAEQGFVAFRETIRIDGAVWLRLHFDDFELGERSYVTITSLQDGAVQRIDAVSLKQYRNASAFFNGDAVEIELHAEPGDEEVRIGIGEITAGELFRGDFSAYSLCGDDDRVPSSDPRVGRLVYTEGGDTLAGGTGWITINTAHVTAGHVATAGMMDILQFNVPLSSCCGDTLRHPHPDDQYAVDTDHIILQDVPASYGSDWAVFPCFPNSNTGLLPFEAQGPGYRVSHDHNPSLVRVTGCGSDGEPDGECPPSCFLNRNNYTLQTDAGPFLSEVFVTEAQVYLRYTVDTMDGNSGSPIIVLGSDITIGNHSDGNCPNSGANLGTSFGNVLLQGAVADFYGESVTYLDNGHPVAAEDGTVFRPYNTLDEAVVAASPGTTIFIVGGLYGDRITISKPMTLKAPVGTAVIGN